MIYITFSTMIELLGKEVEKEVNVDFNEVFQRMTLDAIGPFHIILELSISTSLPLFSFNVTFVCNIALMLTLDALCDQTLKYDL